MSAMCKIKIQIDEEQKTRLEKALDNFDILTTYGKIQISVDGEEITKNVEEDRIVGATIKFLMNLKAILKSKEDMPVEINHGEDAVKYIFHRDKRIRDYVICRIYNEFKEEYIVDKSKIPTQQFCNEVINIGNEMDKILCENKRYRTLNIYRYFKAAQREALNSRDSINPHSNEISISI